MLITHSAEEAFKMSDKIAFISDSTITQYSDPYDIYHRPSSREIANFFGISSYIKAKIVDSSHIDCILGNFVSNIGKHKKSGNVDLLIRPDDIIHDDDSLFSAKVIEKKFRGSDFLYELELKDKQKIFCYAPSHHNHEINEVIGITLNLDHLIIFDN
jgi:iron(III) transport system ATP-binding protein